MKSNLLTYIISWDRVVDDIDAIENDLNSNNIEHVVINSASKGKENWLNIGDKWAYKQIFEISKHALQQTDKQYFSILFGDVTLPENKTFSKIIKQTDELINQLPDCFSYSTSFTHYGWKENVTLKKYNDLISYVSCTDMLYLTLHRDVIKFWFDFSKYIDNKIGLDNIHSGWGMDIVASIYSIYNKKNIFKNDNEVLIHYDNTGYDVDIAHNEMEKIISEAKDFLVEHYKYDRLKLNQIHNMIFEKRSISFNLNYKDFYGIE